MRERITVALGVVRAVVLLPFAIGVCVGVAALELATSLAVQLAMLPYYAQNDDREEGT